MFSSCSQVGMMMVIGNLLYKRLVIQRWQCRARDNEASNASWGCCRANCVGIVNVLHTSCVPKSWNKIMNMKIQNKQLSRTCWYIRSTISQFYSPQFPVFSWLSSCNKTITWILIYQIFPFKYHSVPYRRGETIDGSKIYLQIYDFIHLFFRWLGLAAVWSISQRWNWVLWSEFWLFSGWILFSKRGTWVLLCIVFFRTWNIFCSCCILRVVFWS